ncbi:MAG: type II toxin-antitoxin system Phd/YefM family antitoxin [Geminicoccaceae bacterium]
MPYRSQQRAMKAIGVVEARSTISTLLKHVERGEEIVITKRGKAVARLVPIGAVSRDRLADTATRLKAFRHGRRLGDLSVKALIEEGRR